MTYVGTLRKNKAEIPIEFLPNRSRADQSADYGFTSDMTLLSFVPKKSKAVILISSMHHSIETDTETQKPEIIAFYNSTKGGVDALDQKCVTYNTSRRTRRWPMAIFHTILNISAVNSYIIYSSLNHDLSRLKFMKNLGRFLVEPHMIRRLHNQHLPRELRYKIAEILDKKVPTSEISKTVDNKRKRCALCPRNKDRKTQFRCSECQKPYCMDCRANLCLERGQEK